MKTTTKKINFIFSLLFVFAISATFTSCSKTNDRYNKEIKTADSLFNKQQYLESKTYYVNALKLKKGEAHPTNQIVKIDVLLSEMKDLNNKKDSEIKETEPVTVKEVKKPNPYLVVVGSYEVESNAYARQKKLNNKGFKSSVVKSATGNFLVSIKSFNTLTKSYNYLNSIDENEDFDINEAWVYKIK